MDSFRGGAALVLAVVVSFAAAGLANAQPKPASDSTGFIGIPEYTSSETGLPFFSTHNATRVDGAFRDMRNAIAKCERYAYDLAKRSLSYGVFVQTPADDATVTQQVRDLRWDRDSKTMAEARGKAPPYPVDCVSIPASSAGAQDSIGVMGIPEYTSTETGISFFYAGNASNVDVAFKAMRDAAARCDRDTYDRMLNGLVHLRDAHPRNIESAQANARRRGDRPPEPSALKKTIQDGDNLQIAIDRAPAYFCGLRSTGSKFGDVELVAIGGGMIPLNGTTAVTGVDTFFGPGAYQIDNRSSTSANATAFVGVRARVQTSPGWMAEELDRATRREAIRDSFRIFAETGIQTAFGAQSSLQTFQNVNGTPQGFGSSTINENFQIPILAGVTVPIVSAGTGKPAVLFDLYGGITLDSWTQTLQGRESGAPGGPGFFGQNRRFTVDPTIGVGMRVPVGDIGGLPGITVGVSAELQFRPGSVVTAPSANFPSSETYYGTVNPTANMAIMGRVGIPFGGAR